MFMERNSNNDNGGWWAYDYNTNTMEHLGYGDGYNGDHYNSFNDAMVYGSYFYIGPDWYVSQSGNDTYGVNNNKNDNE